MIPKFPFYKQLGELDCGIACLKMISDFFGKSIPLKKLNKLIQVKEEGVSLMEISDAADQLGFRTMGVKVHYDRLIEDIPTPCIAFWKQQHYVVVYHVNEEYVWVADPANRGIFVQTKETFKEGWICDSANQAGVLLLFETTPEFFETKSIKQLELSHLSTL